MVYTVTSVVDGVPTKEERVEHLGCGWIWGRRMGTPEVEAARQARRHAKRRRREEASTLLDVRAGLIYGKRNGGTWRTLRDRSLATAWAAHCLRWDRALSNADVVTVLENIRHTKTGARKRRHFVDDVGVYVGPTLSQLQRKWGSR